MIIDIEKMTNGVLDGKIVWICDYRYKDIYDKPIRHVPPKRVKIVPRDIANNRRLLYSFSWFAEMNKKDEPLKSKLTPPFDGTGYRMYAGVPLHIFDNEGECRKKYIELCEGILVQHEKRLKQDIATHHQRVNQLKDEMKKHFI